MTRPIILTCALTGAGDTTSKSEHVPITPEQITDDAIAAARAGASMVHIHVRDVETGRDHGKCPCVARSWNGCAPAMSTR